jgi:hypothetical protein
MENRIWDDGLNSYIVELWWRFVQFAFGDRAEWQIAMSIEKQSLLKRFDVTCEFVFARTRKLRQFACYKVRRNNVPFLCCAE